MFEFSWPAARCYPNIKDIAEYLEIKALGALVYLKSGVGSLLWIFFNQMEISA